MKPFTLKYQQRLPVSIEEAWEFFSNPRNLQRITPANLDFTITSEVPDKVHAGLIITYRIKPLLGIPMHWITEITHVQKPFQFIDEQRYGPYRFWHHTHQFKAVEGGVEMTDLIYYYPRPFLLGRLINAIVVRGQLQRIFEFRKRTLDELFGQANPVNKGSENGQ